MTDANLESKAFEFYVDEIRRGSVDPYIAYRVFEHGWQVARADADILRAATIRLLETDPWFLATGRPTMLRELTLGDLRRLTPFVGAGLPPAIAAMLRAKLWYHGQTGPYHPDRAGRQRLRRALALLEKVPRKQRHREWHEMVVGGYRALDYDRYKRAFPALLEQISPSWQASPLNDFLNVVARKQDWSTYHRHRGAWDRLPPDHHACECYTNHVYTNDGLRAAAARDWAAIPALLARAVAVRGCAHLNTGGLRLDLATRLIAKRQQLGAVRTYLERAASFGDDQTEVAALDHKLDAICAPDRS